MYWVTIGQAYYPAQSGRLPNSEPSNAPQSSHHNDYILQGGSGDRRTAARSDHASLGDWVGLSDAQQEARFEDANPFCGRIAWERGGTALSVLVADKIGIGAAVTRRPLPHHRTYGSVYGGSRSYANNLRTMKEGRAI